MFFIVLSVGSISTGGVLRALSPETGSTSVAVMGRQLYEEMRLDQWVCFDAFMQGLRGSEKIDRKNKGQLSLRGPDRNRLPSLRKSFHRA